MVSLALAALSVVMKFIGWDVISSWYTKIVWLITKQESRLPTKLDTMQLCYHVSHFGSQLKSFLGIDCFDSYLSDTVSFA